MKVSSKIFVVKRLNKKFSTVYIIACTSKRSSEILFILNETTSVSIREPQKFQLFHETIVRSPNEMEPLPDLRNYGCLRKRLEPSLSMVSSPRYFPTASIGSVHIVPNHR